MAIPRRPLNILIWHVHGAYLLYLTQSRHRFYLPSRPDRRGHYIGRWGHLPWGPNVIDVPEAQVQDLRLLDCVIFQSQEQYLGDRERILSPEQRRLPRIYLEHEPPAERPVDHRHWVADDPDVLLVHVTPFNELMWDNGRAATGVIEHGVPETPLRYRGGLAKGLTAVNHIATRGRRAGFDLFTRARALVPLDLVGMGSHGLPGGRGEILHGDLPSFEADYRFYFQPMRYASMALAVCEAMMLGLPIVGLATAEMATAVPNGVAGFCDTRIDRLIERMRDLVRDPKLAARLSEGARRQAMERFHLARFVRDWEEALGKVTGV